jgi:predicted ATP-grasp superfamily ATP-dependent carboligase
VAPDGGVPGVAIRVDVMGLGKTGRQLVAALAAGPIMPSVLVTDGQERTALAVVRSLGRAGYRVFVCSPTGRSLAGASRFCVADIRVPDALQAPRPFVEAVERVVHDRRIDILIPISEGSLLALLPEQRRFGETLIPFVSSEQFRRICDRDTVLRAAARLGIATPPQRIITRASDRALLNGDPLRFPLVVKPARSVSDGTGPRVKGVAMHVAERSALTVALDAYRPESYPLLLQHRIEGPGVGVFLLMWDGKVLATFAHRRIREKPPGGGVSVYCESIRQAPDVVQRSVRLLQEFGWQGVAMVEYKIDRNDGTPYLMEVNGRFWGSLQLAIDAGVDFPALLVAAARGRPVEPVVDYRVGVRSRWWWGDVDHLVGRLRHSDAQLAMGAGAPSRWGAIADFLKIWRPGDHSEVFRLSDPLPFARETVNWFLGRSV